MLFVKTQMNIQLTQGSLPFIEPKVNLNLQIIISNHLVSHNNILYAHMFVFYLCSRQTKAWPRDCLGRLCPMRHASKYASFNAKARLWAVVNLCEPKGQTDPGTCYITIACCAPKCHKHLRRLLTFEHTLILFLYLVGQSVLGLQDRQTTFWDDMWKYFVDERRE